MTETTKVFVLHWLAPVGDGDSGGPCAILPAREKLPCLSRGSLPTCPKVSHLGLSLVMQVDQSVYPNFFHLESQTIMAILHSTRHGVKTHRQARAVSCPVCAATYCRRSVRHSFNDFLHRLAGWFPWHCRQCGERFYRRKRSEG